MAACSDLQWIGIIVQNSHIYNKCKNVDTWFKTSKFHLRDVYDELKCVFCILSLATPKLPHEEFQYRQYTLWKKKYIEPCLKPLYSALIVLVCYDSIQLQQ